MEEIWRLKERARSNYSENINMEDKKFVLILFRDACCILKVMGALPVTDGVANTENNGSATAVTDEVADIENIGSPEDSLGFEHEPFRVVTELSRDIVLLENQVPFFILETVVKVECARKDAPELLLEKAIDCVSFNVMNSLSPRAMEPNDVGVKIHHFLHLCHLYIRPTKVYTSSEKDIHCRRAVEYWEAGVRLKKREPSDKYSLLDIKFKNGMLLIPCFVIDERVDYIFRNLLAFEQCTGTGRHVTAYITFMAHLANSREDVSLLCKKGIIQNKIGGEEDVSQLLNKLTYQLMFDPNDKKQNYLKAISEELEKCYKSRASKWLAWLRHNYNHPWLILGAFLVLLSAINTVVELVKHFKGTD